MLANKYYTQLLTLITIIFSLGFQLVYAVSILIQNN